eukprot:5977209-Amphidinium_carterae.1
MDVRRNAIRALSFGSFAAVGSSWDAGDTLSNLRCEKPVWLTERRSDGHKAEDPRSPPKSLPLSTSKYDFDTAVGNHYYKKDIVTPGNNQKSTMK